MIFDCPNCDTKAEGKILSDYTEVHDEMPIVIKYSFGRCPICYRPFLVVQEKDDYGFNFENDIWSVPYQLYPVTELKEKKTIPFAIREIFGEAKKCFKIKAYSATVLMCRKTLEGIAEDKNCKSDNLSKSLIKMKENGLIETQLFDWANLLRITGNQAAHDIVPDLSEQDAQDILEFTYALLEYIYTIQEKYEQFINRKKKL